MPARDSDYIGAGEGYAYAQFSPGEASKYGGPPVLKCVECVRPFGPPVALEGEESAGVLSDRVALWMAPVASVFPSLEFRVVDNCDDRSVCFDLDDWRSTTMPSWDFDGRMDGAFAAGATALAVSGRPSHGVRLLREVLTRCQRLIGRRNQHSTAAVFDEVLSLHRSLYELQKPLVLADYRHALDTWQWAIRLDAGASLPLQVAALFHDIERLSSEPEVRIEQHAADYPRFKATHARRGAGMMRRSLQCSSLDVGTLDRAADLVALHESPDGDAELALLNEADALSFFSLNSSGFLDYYGPVHTRRKIDYTLGRMGPHGVRLLEEMRLRPDVAALTLDVLAEPMARAAGTDS